jgi:hypothetical protein
MQVAACVLQWNNTVWYPIHSHPLKRKPCSLMAMVLAGWVERWGRPASLCLTLSGHNEFCQLPLAVTDQQTNSPTDRKGPTADRLAAVSCRHLQEVKLYSWTEKALYTHNQVNVLVKRRTQWQGVIFTYSMVQNILWKADSHSACQTISSFVMKPEGSLPCSQKPATGPYPEPAESSLLHRYLSP